MEKNLKDFESFLYDSERIAQELAKTLNLPYFNLQFFKIDPEILNYVPEETARSLKVLPLKKEKDHLILGVIDPFSSEIDKLKESFQKTGIKVSLAIISPNSLELGLKEYKFLVTKKTTVKVFEVNEKVFEEVQNNVKTKEDFQNLVVQTINLDPFLVLDYTLAGALKFNASDIHFEPTYKDILVRYRLDGILYDIFTFPKNIYSLIKNRVKVLSKMKINITDQPQDGSFSFVFSSQKVDVRVSISPAVNEETIVMRILLPSQIQKKLEEIGLRDEDLKVVNFYIRQPNGLIINTGPTGSGKTTTLYSILLTIKSPEIKIITIEDPVEYRIEGITQTEVNREANFTFATALRSFLRQDPDVILVGEIRDEETAEIAVQASLTGHLVLSTLHTNDSLGAIPRLISLKVNPKLIPAALRLVIAQRLVRKVCSYCNEEYVPDDDLKKRIKEKLKNLVGTPHLKNIDLENFSLVRAKGCEKCFYTGYKGRIGIFELLKINKKLEEIIDKNPSEVEILNAIADDFVNLQQDGLIKAINKITTIDEVERITGTV
jgi:type II secretory ATPase GspE/PulE/Tfp pilus assembly ATPase PilB-like protein